MKEVFFSDKLILNHQLYNVSELPENFMSSKNSVYEVIRVVNSTPLFVEAHTSRLINSLLELHFPIQLSLNQIQKDLKLFIDSILLCEGNIRIEVRLNKNEFNILIFQVDHSYPQNAFYKSGVTLKTFEIERPHPNVKQSLVNNHVRSVIKDLLENNDVFEVLLVNHFKEITEGSKSNVLFVEGNTIVSPPVENILEGITRQKALELAIQMGYQTINRKITLSEISHFDACFITGTSPKVLPVRKIDNILFDAQNKAIIKIMNAYNRVIENYCQKHSN